MKFEMIVLYLFCVISLSATIINIPADQPTIQAGINASVYADTVLVQPGNYYENINFNGKNIIVASLFITTQDTTFISQTIIDGNQNGSVVTFENQESYPTLLCGFTLTNGFKDYGYGGGIDCYLSSPKISGCIIENNTASHGGGIHVIGSPIIEKNIIRNNSVTVAGGGIRSDEGQMIVRHNTIMQNSSDVYGGGIEVSTSGHVLISSNLIKENFAGIGGAICFHNINAGGIIENNLVIRNSSNYLHSDFGYLTGDHELINNTFAYNDVDSIGIAFGQSCDAVLINNIFWENAEEEIKEYPNVNLDVVHCLVQGGWSGVGNINCAPIFNSPEENDFKLQESSPCIGTGVDVIELNNIWYNTPLFDFEGESRPTPLGSMPDIGAYESILGEPVGIDTNSIPLINNSLDNFPNPFNPTTTIEFSIQNDSKIDLSIFNIKGQKIKSLAQNDFTKGLHSIIWNGDDDSGKLVSTGIYYYKLIVSGRTEAVKKCLLLK